MREGISMSSVSNRARIAPKSTSGSWTIQLNSPFGPAM